VQITSASQTLTEILSATAIESISEGGFGGKKGGDMWQYNYSSTKIEHFTSLLKYRQPPKSLQHSLFQPPQTLPSSPGIAVKVGNTEENGNFVWNPEETNKSRHSVTADIAGDENQSLRTN
jgi:hypothetical protein